MDVCVSAVIPENGWAETQKPRPGTCGAATRADFTPTILWLMLLQVGWATGSEASAPAPFFLHLFIYFVCRFVEISSVKLRNTFCVFRNDFTRRESECDTCPTRTNVNTLSPRQESKPVCSVKASRRSGASQSITRIIYHRIGGEGALPDSRAEMTLARCNRPAETRAAEQTPLHAPGGSHSPRKPISPTRSTPSESQRNQTSADRNEWRSEGS